MQRDNSRISKLNTDAIKRGSSSMTPFIHRMNDCGKTQTELHFLDVFFQLKLSSLYNLPLAFSPAEPDVREGRL